ncbi:hypothetical protein IFM89_016265 [Coptis chinensis]|uniref:Peptidase S8/S53 domain-containing protein n=1 Tax=Coptis chinensis TaxID=261450 RepID=A0A835H6K0_9MAGN|nr:hypothetical protein IFM89_016265 [Coptis chinensis]
MLYSSRVQAKIGIPCAGAAEGHGTHTASTIAGTSIVGANFYGLAKEQHVVAYHPLSDMRCTNPDYFSDPIAIGTFHATRGRIFTAFVLMGMTGHTLIQSLM